MYNNKTIMANETLQIAEVVQQQILNNQDIIENLCKRLQEFNPYFLVTIGRGSSDHACAFAKYLFETKLGLITASASPSTVTVYNAKLAFDKALVIGISQSGKSPDICKMMEVARQQGAVTLAIVNVMDSPMAKTAEFVIPMLAGEEKAVAATKSYIASLTVLANIIAKLTNDTKLWQDFQRLPTLFNHDININWRSFMDNFSSLHNTLVIARGYSFPIALELALKFKETSSIQAEAFSSAELLHGPLALIKAGRPYLLLAQNDKTCDEILALASRIKKLNAKPLLILPKNIVAQEQLTESVSDYWELAVDGTQIDVVLQPILIVQTMYLFLAELAIQRGCNPDSPMNLKKVTETF